MKPIEMALAWAVIHSVWQSSVVAAVLGLWLCVTRSPRIRYALSCAALVAAATAFAATFLHFLPAHRETAIAVIAPAPVPAVLPAIGTQQVVSRWDLHAVLPWVSFFWLAGVCVFNLRNLVSYLAAFRMRRRGVCPAPQFWQERLDTLCLRFHIRRTVTILESCFASIPAVIGHLRPVILLPVGLLSGMPVEQIESILIHELAHIRRFDFAVNVIQTFLESLLFYHPAVWWISKTIRAEREQCCDDFVVNATGDTCSYVAALATLEENRSRFSDLAIAATGGTLVNRILRLVDPASRRRKMPAFSAFTLLVTALLVSMGIVVTAWPLRSAPSEPTASPALRAAVAAHTPVKEKQGRPAAGRTTASPALQKWFDEDAAYIITVAERMEFEALQSDAARERFIKEFWQRRDPTPGTPGNEYRDEHYRRMEYSNGHYGTSTIAGWKTDRGRAYIMWGAPNEIETHPDNYTRPNGEHVPYPVELWLYRYIEGIGRNILIEFVDPSHTGEFRRTASPAPPVPPQSSQTRLEELRKQEAELAVTFRPDNPVRRRLAAQIAELQRVSAVQDRKR